MKAALRQAGPALLLLGLSNSFCHGAAVTPLQKVVQMLQDMKKAGKEEKHQEALQYAEFERFCIDVGAEKNRTIAKADSKLDILKAEIQKRETEAERLGVEIKGHEAKATQLQNDTEAATEVRDSERIEYEKMHEDLSESISALTEAITELKSKKFGDASLLQKVLPVLKKNGRTSELAAFLEQGNLDDPEPDWGAAPEAEKYEFKSTGIIDMMEGLLDKFRGELQTLEEEEVERRHAYNILKQDLTSSLKAEQDGSKEKQKTKARHLRENLDLKADQKDIKATRKDEAEYLADLESSCAQKADEFEVRQSTRTQEIAAIDKAIAILESDEVSAGKKHLPSFVSKQPSLAQLSSARGAAPHELLRVAEFLGSEAERLSSHVLSTIAMTARAGSDPLGKVKRLIEDLIARLMTEAAKEAEHKGFCDTELATNEQTRKSKTAEVESLRAEIDGLDAAITELKKEIPALANEVVSLDAEMGNATELREEEKAKNENTTAEAQAAQGAVSRAIKVLSEFYKEAKANATASLSQKAVKKGKQEPPPIFGSEGYAGQQNENGGVMAMLEVVLSDFEALERETLAAESQSAENHRKFMEDSRIAKAQLETDMKHKKAEKDTKEVTILEKKESLEDAEKLLEGAMEEYEKLKPTCIDTGMSYEERVERRKEEIEALKKALEILSGDFSA